MKLREEVTEMKKKLLHIVFVAVFVLSFMGTFFCCIDTAKAEILTLNITADKDKFKDNTGFYDCWTTGGMLLYVGDMKGTYLGVNQSMIGFDISALPDNIESVKLKIYSQNASGSPKLTVYGSNRDDWTEKNNIFPSKDVEILTNKNITTGWQSMNVTSFVKDQFAGDQYVTFVLSPTKRTEYNVFSFNSSEASSNKPYLEITYAVPSIVLSAPEALTEDNVDGMELNLTLDTTGFTSSPITADMFSLGTAAKENGLNIQSVTYVDDTHVKLKLAQDGRSIQCNFNISVSIDEQYLTTSGTLTSNEVYVEASYVITSGGTYNLDDMGVDANIEINTTEHVILTQTSQDAKENFTITYLVNNADLEIDSIKIDDENSTTDYCIKFMGDSNKLTLSGNSELTAYKYHVSGDEYKGAQAILIDESTMLEITGTGALIAKSGGNTAIGSTKGQKSGTINITGGNITATGGYFAAAIGGGNGGTINISGGTITATGGFVGAGIGTGNRSDGGIVNISGGTITATGGTGGAGIGTGNLGDGGIVNISGGTITANGGDGGAGIGTGQGGDGGIVNISGGLIYARGNVSGMYNERSYDIGNGKVYYGDSCKVSIKGSSVVFLKLNELPSDLDIVVPFHNTETITDHMAYGFSVPDSWSGTAYAYISDNITVTGVSLLPESSRLNINESETLALTTSVTPSYAPDTSVSYSSSDETVATVDASGVVTPVSVGTATITVTTTDGGYTDTCAVTVYYGATGVTLSPDSQTLILGDSNTDNDTLTLEASVFPENAEDKTVSYSSSDETVATVDGNGVVTAISRGTATITVKTTDGGYTDTCDITVEQRVTGVSVSPTNSTLVLGDSDASNDSVSLTDTISPSNANNQDITWTSSDPSVATVDSSGVVTAQKAGTATITATSVDGGLEDTCSVTVEQRAFGVVVSPDLHTLVLGDADTANDTVTLTAAVSPDDASDKTVSYSSSDETVATVDENGVVTAVSRGIATITAKTTDGGYTDTCLITVEQRATGVSVAPASKTLILGDSDASNDSISLTATVSPSNANDQDITWTSSNPSVATVDEFGFVTAIAGGSAAITVTTNDGNHTAVCDITVEQRISGVTLSSLSMVINKGDAAILTAIVSPEDATNPAVTWQSSDTSIATVDGSGKVTAVNAGSATITATAEGKSAVCDVTVVISVSAISLNSSLKTIEIGGTYTLVATVNPQDASYPDVTWSSSNSGVATVTQGGVVTAVGYGTATITATADGKSATCEISVKINVDKVTLSSTAKTVNQGKSFTLSTEVSPANATYSDVTWKSSNINVATVSQNGVVKAIDAGTTIITATADGVSATCTVKVEIPVIDVSLSSGFELMYIGDTLKLVATANPGDATHRNVTWESSDASVATVSSDGTVEAVEIGEAVITAGIDGKSAECSIRVDMRPTPTVTPTATPLEAEPASSPTPIATAGDSGMTITPAIVKRDEQTGKITIELHINELPEGTSSIKLPGGEIIHVADAENGIISITVDENELDAAGDLQIIFLDDQEVPFGSASVKVSKNEGTQEYHSWLLWATGAIGVSLIAASAVLHLRQKKRRNQRRVRR